MPDAEQKTSRQTAGVVLLLCCAVTLIAGCGENVASLNRRAVRSIQAGELASAEELLLEAVRRAPDEPLLHANLAEVYSRLRRYDEAQRHQSRCVELQGGEDPDQNRRLAEILMQNRRNREAVTSLEKLYTRNPDDPEIAYALCVAHLSSDDEGRVRTLLDECERRFPRNPLFQSLEARLALRSGDTGAARSLLEDVIQQHPDFAEAHLLLGDLCFESGEFSIAAERYGSTLAAHNSPEINLKLGKTYSRMGEALAAEKHLRQAIQGKFESEALLELAALYLRNPGGHWGRNHALSQAFESCDRLLAADPLNIRARNLKAMIYAQRHQLGPMLDEFAKSLSVNPNQPVVRAIVDTYQSGEAE